MKKLLFFTLCLAAAITTLAQEAATAINYHQIAEWAGNQKNEYRALLQRHLQGDTTLTLQECQKVYYGFEQQEAYEPYAVAAGGADSLFQARDYTRALPLLLHELERQPVALSWLRKALTCTIALQGKDHPAARNLLKRYGQLTRAVASSGSGHSAGDAMKVLRVSDEYEILTMYLGASKFVQQAIEKGAGGASLDKMTMVIGGEQKDVYFDITPAFSKLGELLR